MKGWKCLTLGEVLQLEYGKPLAPEDRNPTGLYPAYGANGEKDRTNRFYRDQPSIIVGRKGSAGELTLTEEKYWPLDVTYFAEFERQRHDLKFLFYLLTTLDLPSLAKGVKPGINRNEVYAIPVMVPPLAEQRRIVAILDEAFEGIGIAKANTEKNLQSARELLTVGLDAAIFGLMTEDWRASNPDAKDACANLREALTSRYAKAMNSGAAEVSRLPNDVLSIAVPPSWTTASAEQLALHIVDCPHSTPRWTETGVLCLRTTNFKPGFLDLGEVRFVSEHTYTERIARLEPKAGDVLYSREGGILGIACLLPVGVRACLGQRMMMFRLDSSVALPEYFTAVLNSRFILSIVQRLVSGAAAPHLNVRDIRLFPIPLPPVCEQRVIVERLQLLSASVQSLEEACLKKLAALDELKKSLLNRAFSGALTAKFSDKEVAEVA